jgi:serine/threonine protein kinase
VCSCFSRSQVGIYKALLDTASGLDYLHSIGVVHGDLKTANVLLKGGKEQRGVSCKITDFGLSRVLDMNASHISTGTHGEHWGAAVLCCHQPDSTAGRPFGRPTMMPSAEVCNR